jgi:hypothetical protein
MSSWSKYCTLGIRACLSAVGSFVLWTVWLALTLTLAVQLVIVSSQELALPGFVRQRLEEELARAGLRLAFGQTMFDPTGNVLIRDVRFFLPAFPEPVLTAQSVYVRLNPRALLVGEVRPTEISVVGATVNAPAQLTASGRTEELLSALEATLVFDDGAIGIKQCTARAANLALTARGSVVLPPFDAKRTGTPLAEQLIRNFPTLCRQVLAAEQQLARCENPSVHLEVAPASGGTHTVAVTVLASDVSLDAPYAVGVKHLVATTRLRLPHSVALGPLQLAAAEVRLPNGAWARGATATVDGRLSTDPLSYQLRSARVSLESLQVAGVEAHAITALVTPQPLPRVEASITARIFEAPIALQAATDLQAGSARIQFSGAISPRVLDVISQRVKVDVRRFYDFDSLEAEAGDARFGDGWKFQKLTARVHVPRMNSYGVIMEDGRATVELEPGRFYSPEAYARVGDNFARGTYEHNLRTQEFRFLLTGQLRPLAISAWFTSWWPNFFKQLDFPTAPPEASVEVAGQWRVPGKSRVFVFGEVPGLIVRGTPLERTRTRLFIRPGFIDGLELLSRQGDGEAQGTFTLRSAPPAYEWQTLDFDVTSSLDLAVATRLLGPAGERSLAPFRFAGAPRLKVRGLLHGPGAPHPHTDLMKIEADTTGEFRLHDFPLQNVSFAATVTGGDLTVDRFNATYAGGAASGNARIWGQGAARRVGFNAALEEANLGQAATTLQAFLALRRGEPPPPPGKFVQERANVRLNVAASAEGAYDDPLSFQGDGNATLKGAGIGEVPLLGMLSDLFTFASLRFNEARGNFKIAGPKLFFPKIELRGANSTVDAHGDFSLKRNELNFVAKVFPFQESDNVLKTVVGAVLTPLSNVLEVKLGGTLEKPDWAFVMGPSNFLRALAGSGASPADSTPPAAPAAPIPPAVSTPSAPSGPIPAPTPPGKP